MRRNGYFILLAIITTVILAEFLVIFLSIKTTRFLPQQEIQLEMIMPNSETDIKIADDSLKELEKIINTANKSDQIEKLTNVFDKEKTFYITLITVLSILLAIFGIVPVITTLFEKNEFKKLQEEVEMLKINYSEWIANTKQAQNLENLQMMDNKLRQNCNLLSQAGTIVSTLQQFEIYIINFLTSCLKSIDSKYFENEITFQSLALYLHNFINATVIYANMRFQYPVSYTPNNTIIIDISQNTIAKTIFVQMKTLLPKELYDRLKNYYTNFQGNNIIFGDF